MQNVGRYDSSGFIEDQFEPGSRGRVLKNLLGITSKRLMDEREAEVQALALEKFVHYFHEDHRFTSEDIRYIHREWLGNIYEWAGRFRQVNLSRPGITFAAAIAIPQLMEGLGQGPLSKYTPCRFQTLDQVVEALAVVHVEFILIHPFREGNGRVGRMLAILMAMQAGLPGLDFSAIRGKKREEYFEAVRAGLDDNYTPMKRVFTDLVSKVWGLRT